MQGGQLRSSAERAARIVIGAALVGTYAAQPTITWALLGLIPLLTGLMNFCPLYAAVSRRRAATASGEPEPPQPLAVVSESATSETPAAAEEPTPAGPRGRRKGARGGAPKEGEIVHATDSTFDALVLQSDEPVLVDFWADWCGPCRAVAPVLEELARDHAGKARVVKVNVDRCRRISEEYSIRSIPTLALFRDGEVVDVLVGLQSKDRLSRLLQHAEG